MPISVAKIAKSSVWLTLSFLVARFSQLIAQIFLARLLSPEDFGIWGMVLIMTKLSELFRDWAVATVLVQRGIDDKKLADGVYSLGVNISVGMGLLQCVLGYPLAQFFGEPLVFPLTVLVSLVFFISAGAGSHGAVLQRQMRYRELAISDGLAGVGRLLGAIVGASLGWGVWSFAIAEICMSLVSSVLKRGFSRFPFRYHLIPDPDVVKDVGGFISSIVGINLAVYANTNSDNFLIGKLLGSRELGYYSLAYQLAMLPTFALTQLNRVSFAVLSQQEGDEKLSHVRGTLEFYALLYAPLYGIACITAPWLIPLLYGQEWGEAVLLFQIVLVFAYARGFMSILGTALNALNKPHINAAINWALVPLSIPAYFIGARLGGTVGVAIAVALVLGVGATLWFWLAMCRAAHWNVVMLAKPVILPTLVTGASIALAYGLPVPPSLQAYIELPVMILGYLIGISVLSRGEAPRKLFTLIKRILKIKK